MRTDGELLAAWAAGDSRAGEQLFERNFAPIFRFFRNKMEEADARELTQDVFVACVESAAGFRGDSSFRTFLFVVARRKLLNYFRRRRRKEDNIDFGSVSAVDLGASCGQELARSEEQARLAYALSRIPLELQLIVELHYWEELTTAEVAEICGIPSGTVKTRLMRARQLIEAELESMVARPSNDLSSVVPLGQRIAHLRDAFVPPAGDGG
jgi:RNA polymerase sigma-70 factor (ECF subfamily)